VQDEALFHRLHPRQFLQRFTARGVRPDGRALTALRRVAASSGSVSTADGSAMVRVGKTSVVAGIQCLVTYPSQAAPAEGSLDVTVHLNALCAPRYHAKRPSEEAHALAEFIQRTVQRYAPRAAMRRQRQQQRRGVVARVSVL
jgi:exosome complex component RRP43